jgi:hypothetical protein
MCIRIAAIAAGSVITVNARSDMLQRELYDPGKPTSPLST